jgi:signal transduction histidine kinase/ActR/RegA family two-component response regulator
MARRSHLPNLWKLTPALALTTALALLVLSVLLGVANERSYRSQKEDEGNVQARILAATVSAALAFNDHDSAMEYAGALRVNPAVETAAIYDADGALFAAYVRDGAMPPPANAATTTAGFSGDRLVVAAPVSQGGTRLGSVYIWSITEPLIRRLERYGVIGLLVSMASLVVIVLGAAQSTLNKANAELEARAVELARTNSDLEAQIVEREKAEAALRQSQKMEAIGQLSGGIAHDFNNLLTVVRGNIELLQLRLAQGRSDVGKLIELSLKGLDRAANVTQRMLAFSRRQPLSPKPVDLSHLTAEMGELLRHSVGEHIAVEMDLQADWWTLCDLNQMENVILNLAINARDAMPDGGRLTIESANVGAAEVARFGDNVPPGAYVRLAVIDTGTGMSEEVRLKAIDPFFTTKPVGQGTGLGLSMIFGYVKQSKGYLFIDSVLGEGTRVTILMPRLEFVGLAAEPVPAGPSEAALRGPKRSGRVPTILLVEDNELVRTLAVETIREEGYIVLEEENGAAALALIEGDGEIDLLISDVRLPGLSGFQLALAGRARRPGMKILLMTGFSQDPLPEMLARDGVKILYKPFKVDELLGEAKQMLRSESSTAGSNL